MNIMKEMSIRYKTKSEFATLMMRVDTGGLPDAHEMGQLPFKSKAIEG